MILMPFSVGNTMFASVLAVDEWFLTAQPGQRIIYACGNIWTDKSKPGGEALRAVADRILSMSNHDLVSPFQKKIGAGCYEYIAIKRAPIFNNVNQRRRPGHERRIRKQAERQDHAAKSSGTSATPGGSAGGS